MSVSTNPIGKKNYEGPVHGGEGKQHIQGTHPYEYTGVYKSGPNPKLHPVVGYTSQKDGKEEMGGINHALGTASYGGPQRAAFTAKNLGDRHPDDLQHSS